VPTPAAKIAPVEQKQPPRNTWSRKKPGDRKSPRSGDGDQGSRGDGKRKPKMWETLGICGNHYFYRRKARECKPPCLWAGN
jgi:hypothetical protein